LTEFVYYVRVKSWIKEAQGRGFEYDLREKRRSQEMFQGSLKELHLPDVIQLVSVSGKTGAFHLQRDHEEGVIFLETGRIVHAVMDNMFGEEAVYAMATWNDGSFRFVPEEAPPSHSITKNNTNLLMEAARRLDEWKVLSKKIPSLDMIPRFEVPQGKQGKINLNTQEWVILSKVNGTTSIVDIAAAAGLSSFDVAKMLYGLVTMGLVHLEPPKQKLMTPSSPIPRQPQPSAPETDPVMKSLLDRLASVTVEVLGDSAVSGIRKVHEESMKKLSDGNGAEALQYMCREFRNQANILKGAEVEGALVDRFRELFESYNAEQG
jgi:hypothetical protein